MLIGKKVLLGQTERLSVWHFEQKFVPQLLVFYTLFSLKEFSFIKVCLGIMSTYYPLDEGSLTYVHLIVLWFCWA